MVAIGSQIGYLFIYDILKKKFLYQEKVNLGGIEGLVWHGSTIYLCSFLSAIIISLPT